KNKSRPCGTNARTATSKKGQFMKTSITRIDTRTVRKTPRGKAFWPHVVVPDTSFNNRAGVYSIDLELDPRRCADFCTELEELYEAAHLEMLRITHKDELPRENPPWKTNVEGSRVFRFKLKASGVRDDGTVWKAEPPIISDSNGRQFKPDPN